ncbi:MAG: right-handed parallel beta-helix repeat-containing protein [Kiritimatiellia bacterium]
MSGKFTAVLLAFGALTCVADPRGAVEFAVERPDGGKTVAVADYGIVPSAPDNTLALNRLLGACRTNGVRRVVFGQGTYRFVSNGAIRLDGLENFIFDGAGAEFVFFRRQDVNFSIRGCKRIELRDFSIDWDWERDPLGSLVEVAAVDGEHIDFRFVHYEDFPRKDVRVAYTSPWDETTSSVGVEGKGCGRGFDMSWGGKRPNHKKEWLSGNVLRIWIRNVGKEFGVGDKYRMQHYYYDLGNMDFSGNADVFMEKVWVKSCVGHAFLFTKDRRVHFRKVAIRAPEDDPRRVITCTADHLHITRSHGYFKFEACEFSRGADDCINAHDNTAVARERPDDYTLRARSVGKDFFAVGDPIEVMNGDFSKTGFVAPVEAIRPAGDGKGGVDLVFGRKVPGFKTGEFVLFDRRYDTRNIIVRDSYFHDNRARGVIVQCPDVTIERCRFFHHESEAMKITSGWTDKLWCEGYGVTNLVVRDCTFEKANSAGRKGQTLFIGTYRKVPSYDRVDTTGEPFLRDILFENNRFIDTYGPLALAGSCTNCVFRRNCVVQQTPVREPSPERGQLKVLPGADVREE